MAEEKARISRGAVTTQIMKHSAEPSAPPDGWTEIFFDAQGRMAFKRSDGSVEYLSVGQELWQKITGSLYYQPIDDAASVRILRHLSLGGAGVHDDDIVGYVGMY